LERFGGTGFQPVLAQAKACGSIASALEGGYEKNLTKI
jgi:hypothetical protein